VLKILTVHNRYQFSGGEDTVLEAECRLLEERGHELTLLLESNDHIGGKLSSGIAAVSSIYSPSWGRRVRETIRRVRPDVMHVHNFFPLISPAVYYAARAEGVPVVQTLHNYRLICPSGLLFRQDKPCESCLGKGLAWPGVVHGCYRGSRLASAAVATMSAVHRTIGTWDKMVDVYVALTEFAREKFIVGGLPAEKIVIKPNFVDESTGPRAARTCDEAQEGEYALYVGRISAEKGVGVMLQAWRELQERRGCRIRLEIVGDGPPFDELKREYQDLECIEWLGKRAPSEVFRLMTGARALVFPSVWYEGMPLTPIEAFAVGTPVIASNLGAMSTMVEHGRTGLHFEAGNADDLASKVIWAWSHAELWQEMRQAARFEYEARYTAERNYAMLMDIYERAVASRCAR
jgi:glycosyltransferase involved in cell wall biosynthesis